MTAEPSETLALQALGWIAARQELAETLMAASGMAPSDLAERASDPEFLGFVLDFLLADEIALLDFCDEAGIPPEAPMRARVALPGGNLPNWT